MRTSPFDRCGGFAGIRHIVSALYERMLETPSLSRHFAGVDMPTLVDHQTKFIAMVTGGPAKVADEALRRAHARLGISPAEIVETGRLLKETLEDFGVAAADIAIIMTEVEKRAPLVVKEG